MTTGRQTIIWMSVDVSLSYGSFSTGILSLVVMHDKETWHDVLPHVVRKTISKRLIKYYDPFKIRCVKVGCLLSGRVAFWTICGLISIYLTWIVMILKFRSVTMRCVQNGRTVWATDNFWKYKACMKHGNDGTAKCYSCNKLQPVGEDWIPVNGTGEPERKLCLACISSVVVDTNDAQPLYREVSPISP